MASALPYLLAVLGGYLLGSIPFGLIATRMAGLGDVRNIGSGNIGATNVLRTGRKDLALFTLIGDGGKGAAAALIAKGLMGMLAPAAGHDGAETAACLAGGAAFLGHLFPVWLGFKGGKGFATFLGVLLAVAWPAFLLAGATWLLTAWLFRRSSLAALAAAALTPLYVFATKDIVPEGGLIARIDLAVFMAVLVFVRHHQNIRRLLAGTEPRIGDKASAA